MSEGWQPIETAPKPIAPKTIAEASVLAEALQKLISQCPSNWERLDDCRALLANLSPATKTAMAVIEAAVDHRNDCGGTCGCETCEAVTEYQQRAGWVDVD